MKTGPVIVGAVLALYLGFEAYTIKRAGQRIKPDYIHNMLVEARTATERCDSEAIEYKPRFESTLARATDRFKSALAEQHVDASSDAIDQMILQRTQQAEDRIDESLAQSGCESQLMKDHFRRYEIYARKSR